MQACGEVSVRVGDETQPAYADFRPNDAKLRLSAESSKGPRNRPAEIPSSTMDEKSFAHHKDERLSQLPPLLIEAGPYCNLLREARDVFVDGHFYACVAMCGISFERFQRDKAKPHGATHKHKMLQVRKILQENSILSPKTLVLCQKMADLRNKYAHGHGPNPKEDALKALQWMHSFIDNETNLMRDYVIVNGVLIRKHTTKKNYMKKPALYKATVVAFLLIPILAVVRLVYPAPTLNYGEGEVTVNSIFLLLFGIYAFVVLILNFIRSYDYWKIRDDKWKKQLFFTYIFVFIFALSLPFLTIFQAKSYYSIDDHLCKITGSSAFHPKDFAESAGYISLAIFFPIGITLFFLSCAGLKYVKTSPKLYLLITFLTSILFSIGGAASMGLVLVWYIGGGINPW